MFIWRNRSDDPASSNEQLPGRPDYRTRCVSVLPPMIYPERARTNFMTGKVFMTGIAFKLLHQSSLMPSRMTPVNLHKEDLSISFSVMADLDVLCEFRSLVINPLYDFYQRSAHLQNDSTVLACCIQTEKLRNSFVILSKNCIFNYTEHYESLRNNNFK